MLLHRNKCNVLFDAISLERAKFIACFEAIQIAISCRVKNLQLKIDFENITKKIWGIDRIQSSHELAT